MSVPAVAVINFTNALADQRVQAAIRAINRQILEDFAPVWGCARICTLYTANFNPAIETTLAQETISAESAMYLVNQNTLSGALAFHDRNTSNLPVGFVLISDPLDWTTTLSHEVLELILDPMASLFVPGPDPRNTDHTVLHTYSACDAVERFRYEIDGVEVSNFVTPGYFAGGEARDAHNDFLGVGVSSFGVTRNSRVAFFDIDANRFEVFVGNQAAFSATMRERMSAYDHPPPPCPPETELAGVLHRYRSKQLPEGCTGLPNIEGITRTGRYEARARMLRAQTRSAMQ